MKTIVLLSTLAVSLIGATGSFAQTAATSGSYSPAFGFPTYADPAARAPAFGSSDFGYDQGATVTNRARSRLRGDE